MKDPDHPSKRTSTRLHVYSGRTAGQNKQWYMYKYIHPYIALEDAPQYPALEQLRTVLIVNGAPARVQQVQS